MKTNYTKSANGFAMVNGNLVKVEFTKVIAKPNGDIIYTTKDGSEFTNIVTYASVECFESGKQSLLTSDFRRYGRCMDISTEGVLLWRMQDGEPVSERIDTDVDIIGCAQPIIPEGYYTSRGECLKNSVYYEKAEDGTLVEHEGIVHKVQLDKDQIEFVRDLEGMFRKAKEMKLTFIFNDSYESMSVVNRRRFGNHYLAADYMNSSEVEDSVRHTYSNHFHKVETSGVLASENEETAWYED